VRGAFGVGTGIASSSGDPGPHENPEAWWRARMRMAMRSTVERGGVDTQLVSTTSRQERISSLNQEIEMGTRGDLRTGGTKFEVQIHHGRSRMFEITALPQTYTFAKIIEEQRSNALSGECFLTRQLWLTFWSIINSTNVLSIDLKKQASGGRANYY